MLEVLKFIFSNFWIWLGTVILIIAIVPDIHTGNKNYYNQDKNEKEN